MPQTHVLSTPPTEQILRSGPTFDCTLSDGGFDTAWLHVAGDLDLATAPLLEQALRRAETWPRVVLDLRELEFTDCSGMSVILQAGNRATQMGRQLVIVRGRPQVDRVLTLTGVSEVVEVVDLSLVQPPLQALAQLAHPPSVPRRTRRVAPESQAAAAPTPPRP